MRLFVIILLFVAGGAVFNAAAAADKPTREERKREKERVVTEKANAKTGREAKEGRHPSYNNLLKSTNYELMYTEGMRYYNARKPGKNYNSQMNYTRAQKLLDAAQQSQAFTGTPREDSLAFFLGSAFYKSGEFSVSEQIFDNFRRRYAASPMVEDAEYMYAMGFYFRSPKPEYDQSTTLRAMSAISEYEGRYPGTIKKEECDERMAELRGKLYVKSFENAKLYFTIRQYKAAVRALGNAIDEFPESPFREQMLYLITKSAYLFAKNSIPGLQTDRYMAMIDNYLDLISEFPETQHLREVERMQKEAKQHIEKHNNERQNGN